MSTLGLRLDVRQSQQLVMTPQLQQAIKLLQMTNLEVAGYVDEQLAENPFLSGDAAGGGDSEAKPAPVETESPDLANRWDDGWREVNTPSAADRMMTVASSAGGSGSASGGGNFDDMPSFEERLTEPQTLQGYLHEQLSMEILHPDVRLVGEAMIGAIDEAGYLRIDVDTLADDMALPEIVVQHALRAVQGLDPTGVGARTVEECLALQLAELDRLDPAMERLLRHLPMLAKADRRGLLRVCGVDEEDLNEMVAEIRALNPKPGLAFGPAPDTASVPDIWIFHHRGGWRVELNSATLPRVLVDADYYTQVTGKADETGMKQYFAERFQSANWLVKALDQRARTVLRVAEFVVETQSDFLTYGVSHLKPLVLRQVAEGTGLHESTVSRATAGKLVATPQGVFPFKYFFSNAVGGDRGQDAHSAEAIRQQIKSLVDAESACKVLSDDQIVKTLKQQGMTLARRTVAKYRESMGIPSSVDRRRAKNLAQG